MDFTTNIYDIPKNVFRSLDLVTTKSRLVLGPLFIHSFHLFSIIIKHFNKKIVNIKEIEKRKKQHNVRR